MLPSFFDSFRIGCDNLTSAWSLEKIIVEAAGIDSNWEFPIFQTLTRDNSQVDVKTPYHNDDVVNASKEKGNFFIKFPEISWPKFGGKTAKRHERINKMSPSEEMISNEGKFVPFGEGSLWKFSLRN